MEYKNSRINVLVGMPLITSQLLIVFALSPNLLSSYFALLE